MDRVGLEFKSVGLSSRLCKHQYGIEIVVPATAGERTTSERARETKLPFCESFSKLCLVENIDVALLKLVIFETCDCTV